MLHEVLSHQFTTLLNSKRELKAVVHGFNHKFLLALNHTQEGATKLKFLSFCSS